MRKIAFQFNVVETLNITITKHKLTHISKIEHKIIIYKKYVRHFTVK
jgi:hypothetical protein